MKIYTVTQIKIINNNHFFGNNNFKTAHINRAKLTTYSVRGKQLFTHISTKKIYKKRITVDRNHFKLQNTHWSQKTGHLPTWSTWSTHPDSSNLSPLQKDRLWSECAVGEFSGTLDKLEYMQMSLSFRGKDQKIILLCTGSGMRSYRSSTRWKGMFSATHRAVMSRRVSGWREGPAMLRTGPAARGQGAPPQPPTTQHTRFGATAIYNSRALTERADDSDNRSCYQMHLSHTGCARTKPMVGQPLILNRRNLWHYEKALIFVIISRLVISENFVC